MFYDTHAHLDYPDFEGELPQVIERARAAGITRIISVGTSIESSRRALRIAEEFAPVYAVVGWHPSEATSAPRSIKEELRTLAEHPKAVAIGETGTDFYRLPSKQTGWAEDDGIYKERQEALFREQLELAAELGLNVVVHQRESLEATLAIFEPYAARVRAVFHCFVDPGSARRRIEALGSLVSFTGIATFKNAAVVQETIREAPLGEFMLETDSPFLAPVPYRGKRCEPAYVRETAAKVAELKGCTLEELSAATCEAAHKFFPKLR